jgi:hypothetical protein
VGERNSARILNQSDTSNNSLEGNKFNEIFVTKNYKSAALFILVSGLWFVQISKLSAAC